MSEAELCDDFIDKAGSEGFVVYPETCGFDILLVDDTGTQCGVEAKLRPNCDVLYQAYDELLVRDVAGPGTPWQGRRGPVHRAVLVPKAGGAFHSVARWLRLTVFDWSRLSNRHWLRNTVASVLGTAPRWEYPKPCLLPEVVPGVRAGVPSPVRLTKWKLGAIRVSLRIRACGGVTSADIKACGVDPGRWRQGWLRDSGRREGRFQVLVPAPRYVAFDAQHPTAVRQLLDAGKFTDDEARGAALLLTEDSDE